MPVFVVVGEMLPHPDAVHETVQVTPLFAESFVTVAVNDAVVLSSIVWVLTLRLTLMTGGGVLLPPLQPISKTTANVANTKQ